MVFKIDVSFASLKKEIPNKNVSEILKSLPLKTFSSMFRLLLREIDLSSEKNWATMEVMNSSFSVFATATSWIEAI